MAPAFAEAIMLKIGVTGRFIEGVRLWEPEGRFLLSVKQ
jgi:hypothetical protein